VDDSVIGNIISQAKAPAETVGAFLLRLPNLKRSSKAVVQINRFSEFESRLLTHLSHSGFPGMHTLVDW
jgi:hypothetical protein